MASDPMEGIDVKSGNLGFKDARLERALRNRVDDARWRVQDAKTRLSELMTRAKDGVAQLVGQRDPVIIIGVKELESLMSDLNKPETWGEYFSPRPTPGGIGAHLEVPPSETSVLDGYDLDADYGNPTPEQAQQPQLLAALANAYMTEGDLDAAQSVLSVIERPEADDYELAVANVRGTKFSKTSLDVGQRVKGKVIRQGKTHVVLRVDKQGVTAPAFFGTGTFKTFKIGHTVEATVISTPARSGTFAFSLQSTGRQVLVGNDDASDTLKKSGAE